MKTTLQRTAALVGMFILMLVAAPFISSAGKALISSAGAGKITICHATGSPDHPYNEITISVNGLNGHSNHANDIIPAPSGGCPGSITPPTSPAPTIALFSTEGPSVVNVGTGSSGTSTATWSSTDATGCAAATSKTNNVGFGLTATSSWVGPRAVSGSQLVNFTGIGAGDDIDFALALTCTGPGGTASATTTVNVYNDTPN